MLVIPPPPLIKVASNTRPYSKLGGTTLSGREEGGQYDISQTCDQERFEARKCLNIFGFGCSIHVSILNVSPFWGSDAGSSVCNIILSTKRRETMLIQ